MLPREKARLAAADTVDESGLPSEPWRAWGPYLAERAWGTVREDYSPGGSAWDSFPHDHARSRAYRWNEDGLAGICDDQQRFCFALALWNGVDPILKELQLARARVVPGELPPDRRSGPVPRVLRRRLPGAVPGPVGFGQGVDDT